MPGGWPWWCLHLREGTITFGDLSVHRGTYSPPSLRTGAGRTAYLPGVLCPEAGTVAHISSERSCSDRPDFSSGIARRRARRRAPDRGGVRSPVEGKRGSDDRSDRAPDEEHHVLEIRRNFSVEQQGNTGHPSGNPDGHMDGAMLHTTQLRHRKPAVLSHDDQAVRHPARRRTTRESGDVFVVHPQVVERVPERVGGRSGGKQDSWWFPGIRFGLKSGSDDPGREATTLKSGYCSSIHHVVTAASCNCFFGASSYFLLARPTHDA